MSKGFESFEPSQQHFDAPVSGEEAPKVAPETKLPYEAERPELVKVPNPEKMKSDVESRRRKCLDIAKTKIRAKVGGENYEKIVVKDPEYSFLSSKPYQARIELSYYALNGHIREQSLKGSIWNNELLDNFVAYQETQGLSYDKALVAEWVCLKDLEASLWKGTFLDLMPSKDEIPSNWEVPT